MSRWFFSMAPLALALGCQGPVVIDISADAPLFADCPVREAPTFEYRRGDCSGTDFLRFTGGDIVSLGPHCFRATVYSECGEMAVAESAVEVTRQAQQRVELHFGASTDAPDRSCDAMRIHGAPLTSLQGLPGAVAFGASRGCAVTYENSGAALRCWGPNESAVLRASNESRFSAFEVYGGTECWSQGRTGECRSGDNDLWRPEFASATSLEASESSVCAIVAVGTRDRLVCAGAANAESYERMRDPAVRLSGLSVFGNTFCVLEDSVRLHCEDVTRAWTPPPGDVMPTLALSAVRDGMACISARRGREELYCGTSLANTRDILRSFFPSPPPRVESLCVGDAGGCAVLQGEVFCWSPDARGELVHQRVELPGFASQVACGATSACAAVSAENGLNEIWCWGANEHHELGRARGHAPAEICVEPA